MSRIKAWLLAGAVLLGLISAMAQAQTDVRVRGTITGFDGHVLEVKTREGISRMHSFEMHSCLES